MKNLTIAIENIGGTGVKTYIQSGNVVFQKPGSKASHLEKTIGKEILKSHDFEPRVLVLTTSELEKAMASNPFPHAVAEPKSLHLSFLAQVPNAPDFDSLNDAKASSESFALIGKVFYFHAPDGIGRSKLAARVEKLLGVEATGRNWRTVSKLLELAKS
jgi:uncharacterized protein (DUF1697 family)